MSLNVIFTAENRKYMHVGFAINVIQTAKNRKYMHVGFAINVIQSAKYRKYMHIEIGWPPKIPKRLFTQTQIFGLGRPILKRPPKIPIWHYCNSNKICIYI